MQRLDKILSNSGYGSRKELKEYIKKGLVRVNARVVKSPEEHVNPETDEIFLNGEKLIYKKFIYIMMNKPAGVLTAARDKNQKTVYDLLPEFYKKFDLSSVGRLDKDTEGLLVLTNDGNGIHKLISPKKHKDKVYFAVLEKELTEQDILTFQNGIDIGGYVAMPAKLQICERNTEAYITLHEGKFHQVKRMFEALENKVLFLKRVKIGGLKLDPSLELGKMRELTEEEVRQLYE